MEKIRFGIIGIGNMGATHAKNLFEGKVPGAENQIHIRQKCDAANDVIEIAAHKQAQPRPGNLLLENLVDPIKNKRHEDQPHIHSAGH